MECPNTMVVLNQIRHSYSINVPGQLEASSQVRYSQVPSIFQVGLDTQARSNIQNGIFDLAKKVPFLKCSKLVLPSLQYSLPPQESTTRSQKSSRLPISSQESKTLSKKSSRLSKSFSKSSLPSQQLANLFTTFR